MFDDEGLEQPWPAESREEYQIAKATLEGKATAKLLQETQRNVRQLGKFKSWLNSRAIRAKFTTPEDLRGKAEAALREWTKQTGGQHLRWSVIQSAPGGQTACKVLLPTQPITSSRINTPASLRSELIAIRSESLIAIVGIATCEFWGKPISIPG